MTPEQRAPFTAEQRNRAWFERRQDDRRDNDHAQACPRCRQGLGCIDKGRAVGTRA